MTQTPVSHRLDYDDALELFLDTSSSYAGGLSNHGPMAVEALVSMDVDHWIEPFVARYRTRLEPPSAPAEPAPAAWQSWLRDELPALVPQAATLAGHGLLRVAHAVRGLERTTGEVPLVRRRELATAVRYWRRGGLGLDGPDALAGPLSADDWMARLDRLPVEARPEGNLTATLRQAAATPDFAARIAALAPAPEPGATLDALAVAPAGRFARNTGLPAFALLHGTTVSSMARLLLPHLEERDQHRLEASVAGFVGSALIGYDSGAESVDHDVAAVPSEADLAEMAAASLEDHTIKFADACLSVAARTGATAPLVALHRQIVTPYGMPPG